MDDSSQQSYRQQIPSQMRDHHRDRHSADPGDLPPSLAKYAIIHRPRLVPDHVRNLLPTGVAPYHADMAAESRRRPTYAMPRAESRRNDPGRTVVPLAAHIPREVDAVLRVIARNARLSISAQVTRALLLYLKEPPRSIEEEEVLDPRLLNLELEEEAILADAKMKMEEARRITRRVEGWRKARLRQQKESEKPSQP